MKKKAVRRKEFVLVRDINVYWEGKFPDGYQRALKPYHAKSISDNFDPDRFGVIYLSRRADGTYYVLDGQHRLAALGQLGDSYVNSKVECYVYEGLSIPEEASIFYGLNHFLSPLPLTRFNALRVAKDETTIAIVKIAEQHGYIVGSNDAHGSLRCTHAISTLYAKSPDALSSTLEVCAEAWPKTAGPPADVIRGIGTLFVKYNGAVDKARLSRLLRQNVSDPSALVPKARASREVLGGTIDANLTDIVITLYNRKLQRDKLPLIKGSRRS